VSGQVHTPAALPPGKEPCYPLVRKLVVERRKNLSPFRELKSGRPVRNLVTMVTELSWLKENVQFFYCLVYCLSMHLCPPTSGITNYPFTILSYVRVINCPLTSQARSHIFWKFEAKTVRNLADWLYSYEMLVFGESKTKYCNWIWHFAPFSAPFPSTVFTKGSLRHSLVTFSTVFQSLLSIFSTVCVSLQTKFCYWLSWLLW
jgi:hypothetical protein